MQQVCPLHQQMQGCRKEFAEFSSHLLRGRRCAHLQRKRSFPFAATKLVNPVYLYGHPATEAVNKTKGKRHQKQEKEMADSGGRLDFPGSRYQACLLPAVSGTYCGVEYRWAKCRVKLAVVGDFS